MNSFRLARNTRYLIYLPVFFLIASIVTSASAEQYKIGVVDAMAVLEQSPQAERMSTQLREEFQGRNKKILEMQKRMTDMNEKLTNNATTMSESQTADLEQNIYLLKRDLKRAEDEYKEDFSYRRNEILSKLQEEIAKAIQIVSKQNHYDIVLTSGVNWASPKMNMTPLVVEYLKNQKKKKK